MVKGISRKPRNPISTYNTLNPHPTRPAAAQSAITEFARRLQAAMIQKGWSQSELARRATQQLPKPVPGQAQNRDLGRSRISHYVRGISLPRPEGLAAIARALGCAPADLLPPDAVPTAVPAPFEMKAAADGRVSLRINRTVTLATATAIINLLAKEDQV